MRPRLRSAIRYEVVLLFRHYFFHVYAIVSLFYIVVLRFIPVDIRVAILPALLFSDPGMLGFFFIAAIVLFEKDARSTQAISVSPLRPREYLLSKAVALAMLSLSASLAVAVATVGLGFSFGSLILSITLCGMVFALVGFCLVARHKTFSTFLLEAMMATLLINLPFLDLLGILESPFFYVLPSHPAIRAVVAAMAGKLAILDVSLLVLWVFILLAIGQRQFRRHIVGRG